MNKKKKTVIVNKRRFVTFLTIMLMFTCCGFSSVRKHTTSADSTNYILIHVQPGDTLWSIARSNSYGNKNTRSLVHEIKKYNNLKSSTIYVGDELVIPV